MIKSDLESTEKRRAYPIIKPIKKHPNKFTVSVPQGKVLFSFGIILISRYLAKLPKPPPKKTNINCFKTKVIKS